MHERLHVRFLAGFGRLLDRVDVQLVLLGMADVPAAWAEVPRRAVLSVTSSGNHLRSSANHHLCILAVVTCHEIVHVGKRLLVLLSRRVLGGDNCLD